MGTHSVPHVLWLMVSRTGSLLEGRKERCSGDQVTPMRDGCWPRPPAPQLDAVTISGRKNIANHPNTGAEISLKVFNALKGLSAVLKSTLPKGKKKEKSDYFHSNSGLALVLQNAEQRGKKKKAWMKSCYGGPRASHVLHH